MVSAVEVRKELGHFFQVAMLFQRATGKIANMPRCIVDLAWHKLLEDQDAYTAFTQEAVGYRIEHVANKGEGKIEWITIYKELFGKLPSLWCVSPSGDFDQHGYDDYLKTGVLKMAWDCIPLNPDHTEDSVPTVNKGEPTSSLALPILTRAR